MKFILLLSILDAAAAFTSPARLITTTKHPNHDHRLYSTYDTDSETTLIDIDEEAPRDIPSMEAWSYEMGAQRTDGFTLTTDDGGYNVYAMTNVDLPTGSPILTIPEHMILSSNKAMAELRTSDMSEAEKIVKSVNAESEFRHYYLMLKLLVEYEKGMESPWYQWMNSLPRYYTNAASMTPFCCLCLPSLMRKLTVQERGYLQRLGVSSIKMVPYLNEDTKYDVDLCTWVYQIVYTRSFETADGDLKIVPLADMFNHGAYPEVESSYDEEGNYYAYTTYDVPAGSPLRMSYGDPTNPSYLFARYGFLDESTEATFCKIIPEHINKDMEELGYAHNRMLFYKDGNVSEEVWDILLFQHVSSTKIGDKRALMEAHRSGDYATKQMLHEKYYENTSAMLLEHLESFLEQLEKLSSKAGERQTELGDHPRLPLILAHNEFVKQTFLAVRMQNFGY
ncbi:SET domain-containing protein [Skeletonema marinoi]|uniref:SET domain-containing protein n=1 Tax=Skeletonema marinoi TaxID=267567 RepID=A0AAD9DBZ4_9STRA|nr:SET domain-containing protein [Skeletonema marinoi]